MLFLCWQIITYVVEHIILTHSYSFLRLLSTYLETLSTDLTPFILHPQLSDYQHLANKLQNKAVFACLFYTLSTYLNTKGAPHGTPLFCLSTVIALNAFRTSICLPSALQGRVLDHRQYHKRPRCCQCPLS